MLNAADKTKLIVAGIRASLQSAEALTREQVATSILKALAVERLKTWDRRRKASCPGPGISQETLDATEGTAA